MKYKFGEKIINDYNYINKLKGLICGFSEYDLENLSAITFLHIDQIVFKNIWSCTREQIQIFLNIAQKPEVYGPYELWNEDVLRKIGLLMTEVKVEDFERFYVKAFEGLELDVVDAMSDDQCQWLSRNNLGHKIQSLLANYNLRITNGSDSIFSDFFICAIIVNVVVYLVQKD